MVVDSSVSFFYTSSAPATPPPNPSGQTPKDAQKTAKRFAKDVSCDMSDTACLRAVDVHDVLEAQAEAQNHIPIPHPLNLFYPWTPNIDGPWCCSAVMP